MAINAPRRTVAQQRQVRPAPSVTQHELYPSNICVTNATRGWADYIMRLKDVESFSEQCSHIRTMENSIFGMEATAAIPLATSTELFNDLGKRYESACSHNEGQARSLQWLVANLPSQSKIYDIGCGTGRPATGIFADAGMDVTGLDISPVMLKVAAEQVPNAKFVEADLRTWEPPSESEPVDCGVAYFSLICDVTQDDIRGFFIRVYRWLKPGGLFVFGTVPLAGNMVPFKWLGRNSAGSGLDVHDNLNSINVAGFRIEKHEMTVFEPKAVEAGLCSKEEAWPEEHLFVYARRP